MLMKLVTGCILVLVCLMGSAFVSTKAQVTCGTVVNDLSPCISYVSYGGAVPTNCCKGVRTLYNAARSTADRQTVCTCLKQAVGGISYTRYQLGLAAGLPGKCGLNIPYQISPSTDCSRYVCIYVNVYVCVCVCVCVRVRVSCAIYYCNLMFLVSDIFCFDLFVY